MAKIVVIHKNLSKQQFDIGNNDKIAWIILWDNEENMIKYFREEDPVELKKQSEIDFVISNSLRHRSYANAERLIDECQIDEFKWLLNEVWDRNANYWIDNHRMHETQGFESIMKYGFTRNQMKWIKHIQEILYKITDGSNEITDNIIHEESNEDKA
jgi:hypothetical protein